MDDDRKKNREGGSRWPVGKSQTWHFVAAEEQPLSSNVAAGSTDGAVVGERSVTAKVTEVERTRLVLESECGSVTARPWTCTKTWAPAYPRRPGSALFAWLARNRCRLRNGMNAQRRCQRRQETGRGRRDGQGGRVRRPTIRPTGKQAGHLLSRNLLGAQGKRRGREYQSRRRNRRKENKILGTGKENAAERIPIRAGSNG